MFKRMIPIVHCKGYIYIVCWRFRHFRKAFACCFGVFFLLAVNPPIGQAFAFNPRQSNVGTLGILHAEA